MLKHLGVCRAAGGEKPPKSEGGGSELCERGELTRLDFKTTETQRHRELYVIKRRFWRKYLEHIEILSKVSLHEHFYIIFAFHETS